MVVPVCFKTPLLCLLTQKTAQKFGYVLGIGGQKPQGRRGKTPSGARNRYAIRLAGHQSPAPYYAGWDRMGIKTLCKQIY